MPSFQSLLPKSVIILWICNCLLGITIAVKQIWIPYMNAENTAYSNILSDPFDGTTMPIAYIPDWTKTENQDKSKRFEDIAISEYLPIPLYDALSLGDTTLNSKSSTILHYTYITPYMGNYLHDYKEYVWGHLGVDIRAPIGTPVLSIANGVIVRANEADATGNKYIVVRHDQVNFNGKKTSIYSWYLHLSEILVSEGTKVKKGEMIGRVGMTGIATTPHLHLQIDTNDSPFHPYWHFSSSEAKNAGLWFFDAINTGLNKNLAERYTIHPMNFINQFLWGSQESFSSAPEIPKNTPIQTGDTSPSQTLIASYIPSEEKTCTRKRYSDVAEKSTLGAMLYPLIDKKCLFQDVWNTLRPKETITKQEAIRTILDYYEKIPSNGTSPFLDIPIGDSFQWYALTASRFGILEGNYAYSNKIITKEEFVDILMKVGRPGKNPSGIQIYSDVTSMNPYYESVQDYGFLTRARWGKFWANTILTRSTMIQILASLSKKK